MAVKTQREITDQLRRDMRPVDEAIVASLRAIREAFAASDDSPHGDYLERWGKALLDERPLIVLSLVNTVETLTWVMDMHMDEAVSASAIFLHDEFASAESVAITYPLEQIRELANWLYRGKYCARLDYGVARWEPPEDRAPATASTPEPPAVTR